MEKNVVVDVPEQPPLLYDTDSEKEATIVPDEVTVKDTDRPWLVVPVQTPSPGTAGMEVRLPVQADIEKISKSIKTIRLKRVSQVRCILPPEKRVGNIPPGLKNPMSYFYKLPVYG
jgi:hypothetical protein